MVYCGPLRIREIYCTLNRHFGNYRGVRIPAWPKNGKGPGGPSSIEVQRKLQKPPCNLVERIRTILRPVCFFRFYADYEDERNGHRGALTVEILGTPTLEWRTPVAAPLKVAGAKIER